MILSPDEKALWQIARSWLDTSNVTVAVTAKTAPPDAASPEML
jgi:hypothetical protein